MTLLTKEMNQKKNHINLPKNPSEKYLIKDFKSYQKKWKESIENPADFWGHEAIQTLSWQKNFTHVFSQKNHKIKWFDDGTLNISYNCLDRHLPKKSEKPALIWENERGESEVLTYKDLHKRVVKFSSCLKNQGLKPGDAVTVYLSMTPDLVVTLLSCCRIGVLHNVVFAGFSSEALKARILDSNSKLVITADAFLRKNKVIKLKEIVDNALDLNSPVKKVLLFNNKVKELKIKANRDLWVKDLLSSQGSKEESLEFFPSEHPLFLLYTSGSTGVPKGLLHTSAGYLLNAQLTCKYLFNLKDDDIFWCTADIGWITGHNYVVYGPLAQGSTVFMYDGAPNVPHWGQWWSLIEKYKITKLYTAPTALRMFMKEGQEWPDKYNLDSLKLLGSVGEPINPKTWHWYFDKIGQKKCPILDTWWQTETGAVMLSGFPGVTELKPGCASLPFFGVDPQIEKNENGSEENKGQLIIKQPWPSIARTIYNNHERYKKEYWDETGKHYQTKDGAYQDSDDYYWILGRLDDVINISGHRISTMEAEALLVNHPDVVEAAATGISDKITGQALSCFVVLTEESKSKDESLVRANLKNHLISSIGSFAKPKMLTICPGLPKTRSGKILRRALRSLSCGEEITSDLSTLEDPSSLDNIRRKI